MLEYSIEKEIEIMKKDLRFTMNVRDVQDRIGTLLHLIEAINKRINEIYDASSFPEEIE